MTEFEDMTPLHAAQIAAIEKETFAEPWSEGAIAKLAEDGRAVARVLVSEGKVIAYYSMYVVAGEGFVNNLAVAPDMRGKGYGKALMRDVMYVASLSGITAVTLEVRESNAVARSLYEKWGFQAEGVRKRFYPDGENAVIYWLHLSE